VIVLQAQLNNFPHSFHKSVKILCLGMATSQGGHSRDIIVFFVSFDNDSEFPLGLHPRILAWQI
jgi:hypothetical protein